MSLIIESRSGVTVNNPDVHINSCPYVIPSNHPNSTSIESKLRRPTKDHIVPRVALRDYKAIGRILSDGRDNLVGGICEFHHGVIDRAKIAKYNNGGLSDLLAFIARYPRFANGQAEAQYYQWLELFGRLKGPIEEFSHRRGGEKFIPALLVVKTNWRNWNTYGIEEFKNGGLLELPSREGNQVIFA